MESLYKLYNAKACGELCPEDCIYTGNTKQGCRKTLDYSMSTDKLLKLEELLMTCFIFQKTKYKFHGHMMLKTTCMNIAAEASGEHFTRGVGYGYCRNQVMSELLIDLYYKLHASTRNEIKAILEE